MSPATPSVLLMSTTCLPSISPRVSNVGPGPNATKGTVTTDSSNPNATMGTSATTSVKIRLFTPPTVEVRGQVGPHPAGRTSFADAPANDIRHRGLPLQDRDAAKRDAEVMLNIVSNI